jgi:hypothetical protein
MPQPDLGRLWRSGCWQPSLAPQRCRSRSSHMTRAASACKPFGGAGLRRGVSNRTGRCNTTTPTAGCMAVSRQVLASTFSCCCRRWMPSRCRSLWTSLPRRMRAPLMCCFSTIAERIPLRLAEALHGGPGECVPVRAFATHHAFDSTASWPAGRSAPGARSAANAWSSSCRPVANGELGAMIGHHS